MRRWPWYSRRKVRKRRDISTGGLLGSHTRSRGTEGLGNRGDVPTSMAGTFAGCDE